MQALLPEQHGIGDTIFLHGNQPLHFVPPYGGIKGAPGEADVEEHVAPLLVSSSPRVLQMHECIRMLAAQPDDVEKLCEGAAQLAGNLPSIDLAGAFSPYPC